MLIKKDKNMQDLSLGVSTRWKLILIFGLLDIVKHEMLSINSMCYLLAALFIASNLLFVLICYWWVSNINIYYLTSFFNLILCVYCKFKPCDSFNLYVLHFSCYQKTSSLRCSPRSIVFFHLKKLRTKMVYQKAEIVLIITQF